MVSSAAAVAWQFSSRDPEARDKVALRIIACSFFALSAYVTVESVRALTGSPVAEHSTVGLVLAAASLAVVPMLSYAQRRAGREPHQRMRGWGEPRSSGFRRVEVGSGSMQPSSMAQHPVGR